MVWNILTILMLVAILCVISVFFLIFVDPNSDLNPFPPPTLFPSMAVPTITVTPRFTLVPSWTPTNALEQITNTPGPTHTPLFTTVPLFGEGDFETTSTPPPGGYAFSLQQGSPAAIDGAEFHPDSGCNWSGVAGKATSLNGEDVSGLFVELGGELPGVATLEKLAMTGEALQYGPGGFEFTLSSSPVASSDSLWVQVLDQQNLPLSDRVYFDTYDECQKNLIIIYFVQVQ